MRGVDGEEGGGGGDVARRGVALVGSVGVAGVLGQLDGGAGAGLGHIHHGHHHTHRHEVDEQHTQLQLFLVVDGGHGGVGSGGVHGGWRGARLWKEEQFH